MSTEIEDWDFNELLKFYPRTNQDKGHNVSAYYWFIYTLTKSILIKIKNERTCFNPLVVMDKDDNISVINHIIDDQTIKVIDIIKENAYVHQKLARIINVTPDLTFVKTPDSGLCDQFNTVFSDYYDESNFRTKYVQHTIWRSKNTQVDLISYVKQIEGSSDQGEITPSLYPMFVSIIGDPVLYPIWDLTNNDGVLLWPDGIKIFPYIYDTTEISIGTMKLYLDTFLQYFSVKNSALNNSPYNGMLPNIISVHVEDGKLEIEVPQGETSTVNIEIKEFEADKKIVKQNQHWIKSIISSIIIGYDKMSQLEFKDIFTNFHQLKFVDNKAMGNRFLEDDKLLEGDMPDILEEEDIGTGAIGKPVEEGKGKGKVSEEEEESEEEESEKEEETTGMIPKGEEKKEAESKGKEGETKEPKQPSHPVSEYPDDVKRRLEVIGNNLDQIIEILREESRIEKRTEDKIDEKLHKELRQMEDTKDKIRILGERVGQLLTPFYTSLKKYPLETTNDQVTEISKKTRLEYISIQKTYDIVNQYGITNIYKDIYNEIISNQKRFNNFMDNGVKNKVTAIAQELRTIITTYPDNPSKLPSNYIGKLELIDELGQNIESKLRRDLHTIIKANDVILDLLTPIFGNLLAVIETAYALKQSIGWMRYKFPHQEIRNVPVDPNKHTVRFSEEIYAELKSLADIIILYMNMSYLYQISLDDKDQNPHNFIVHIAHGLQQILLYRIDLTYYKLVMLYGYSEKDAEFKEDVARHVLLKLTSDTNIKPNIKIRFPIEDTIKMVKESVTELSRFDDVFKISDIENIERLNIKLLDVIKLTQNYMNNVAKFIRVIKHHPSYIDTKAFIIENHEIITKSDIPTTTLLLRLLDRKNFPEILSLKQPTTPIASTPTHPSPPPPKSEEITGLGTESGITSRPTAVGSTEYQESLLSIENRLNEIFEVLKTVGEDTKNVNVEIKKIKFKNSHLTTEISDTGKTIKSHVESTYNVFKQYGRETGTEILNKISKDFNRIYKEIQTKYGIKDQDGIIGIYASIFHLASGNYRRFIQYIRENMDGKLDAISSDVNKLPTKYPTIQPEIVQEFSAKIASAKNSSRDIVTKMLGDMETIQWENRKILIQLYPIFASVLGVSETADCLRLFSTWMVKSFKVGDVIVDSPDDGVPWSTEIGQDFDDLYNAIILYIYIVYLSMKAETEIGLDIINRFFTDIRTSLSEIVQTRIDLTYYKLVMVHNYSGDKDDFKLYLERLAYINIRETNTKRVYTVFPSVNTIISNYRHALVNIGQFNDTYRREIDAAPGDKTISQRAIIILTHNYLVFVKDLVTIIREHPFYITPVQFIYENRNIIMTLRDVYTNPVLRVEYWNAKKITVKHTLLFGDRSTIKKPKGEEPKEPKEKKKKKKKPPSIEDITPPTVRSMAITQVKNPPLKLLDISKRDTKTRNVNAKRITGRMVLLNSSGIELLSLTFTNLYANGESSANKLSSTGYYYGMWAQKGSFVKNFLPNPYVKTNMSETYKRNGISAKELYILIEMKSRPVDTATLPLNLSEIVGKNATTRSKNGIGLRFIFSRIKGQNGKIYISGVSLTI